jgi:hypothetical protein
MSPESRIAAELADATCKRVARQVRHALQRMTDCRLSGEDSGLKNTWEELCAQVQFQESFAWPAYEEIVQLLLGNHVRSLRRFELEAVWVQTKTGQDWLFDDDAQDHTLDPRPPINESEVVDHLREEYVHKEAADWSNPRIRDYLDRSTPTD